MRALAAFMVFTWHFLHVKEGHLAEPIFPGLSFLTEGHTGVALFMVLSGYLFAKLLENQKILYVFFIWNRILRLAPLMILVIVLVGIQKYFQDQDLWAYSKSVLAGVLKPSLPNGGWSITVEFHFYIILPLLMILMRKWQYSLIFIVLLMVAFRFLLHDELGQVQRLSYGTIIGRIDQFILGILIYHFRHQIANKHALVVVVISLFTIFYWFFDDAGGFYMNTSYPSPSVIWVYMPTIEGIAYGILILWYDNSFRHSNNYFSRFIASIGTYSYSIYLLHFFIVFEMAGLIDTYIYDLSNTYIAILFSLICFIFMQPLGRLSYTFIELPFLQFRKRYISALG